MGAAQPPTIEMLGTCKSKGCNHRKPIHKDAGKGACKVLGCPCKGFKAKGLLEA